MMGRKGCVRPGRQSKRVQPDGRQAGSQLQRQAAVYIALQRELGRLGSRHVLGNCRQLLKRGRRIEDAELRVRLHPHAESDHDPDLALRASAAGHSHHAEELGLRPDFDWAAVDLFDFGNHDVSDLYAQDIKQSSKEPTIAT